MDQIQTDSQYSLTKILIIYLCATIPMATLGWVIAPLLAPYSGLPNDVSFGITLIFVFTIGLIWLFVLSLIIIYQEYNSLSLRIIKERLWLNKPKTPGTEQEKISLLVWLLPFSLLVLLISGLLSPIQTIIVDFFHVDPKYIPDSLFATKMVKFYSGAYWFLVLIIIFAIFNTVLGEEFLFRGILLPKMNGKFGKYDWAANGLLIGLYHLHQPWGIPLAIVENVFCFSYASKKFKSIWFGIALHSLQSILLIVIIASLVFS